MPGGRQDTPAPIDGKSIGRKRKKRQNLPGQGPHMRWCNYTNSTRKKRNKKGLNVTGGKAYTRDHICMLTKARKVMSDLNKHLDMMEKISYM